jgi:hypothetical protein
LYLAADTKDPHTIHIEGVGGRKNKDGAEELQGKEYGRLHGEGGAKSAASEQTVQKRAGAAINAYVANFLFRQVDYRGAYGEWSMFVERRGKARKGERKEYGKEQSMYVASSLVTQIG